MAFLQRTHHKETRRHLIPGSGARFRRRAQGPAGRSRRSWSPGLQGGPRSPAGGKDAAVGVAGGGGGSSWPAGQVCKWWLQPARGAGSGPASVLMVPNDHLAVQLLLLLFERVLHLLPLQPTIPDERKAGVRAKASRPPLRHSQPHHAAPNPRTCQK